MGKQTHALPPPPTGSPMSCRHLARFHQWKVCANCNLFSILMPPRVECAICEPLQKAAALLWGRQRGGAVASSREVLSRGGSMGGLGTNEKGAPCRGSGAEPSRAKGGSREASVDLCRSKTDGCWGGRMGRGVMQPKRQVSWGKSGTAVTCEVGSKRIWIAARVLRPRAGRQGRLRSERSRAHAVVHV